MKAKYFFYLSSYLSILSIYLCIYLSIYLSLNQSIGQITNPAIPSLSLHLSIIYLCAIVPVCGVYGGGHELGMVEVLVVAEQGGGRIRLMDGMIDISTGVYILASQKISPPPSKFC